MTTLFQILVPTIYGDTEKPISTKHHKNWDKLVVRLTGGLTILKPVQGRWLHQGKEYAERIIPVHIMCDESLIRKVAVMTMKHYRQKAVMYYPLSTQPVILHSASSHCPHPARAGRHEVYLRGGSGTCVCRACGAEIA